MTNVTKLTESLLSGKWRVCTDVSEEGSFSLGDPCKTNFLERKPIRLIAGDWWSSTIATVRSFGGGGWGGGECERKNEKKRRELVKQCATHLVPCSGSLRP